eukprot:4525548-Ditylum_brightwellii.AAC.1
MEAGVASFSAIFLAGAVANDQNVGNQPQPSTAHYDAPLLLLQALWHWNWAVQPANGHVQYDTACHPNQPTAANSCAEDIRTCFLTKLPCSTLQAQPNTLVVGVVMLSHSINQLTATCASSLASSLSSSKKGAHKLIDKTKTMLPNAASDDSINPAYDLPPPLWHSLRFLQQQMHWSTSKINSPSGSASVASHWVP